MLTSLVLSGLLLWEQSTPERMWTGNAAGASVRVVDVNLNDPRVHVNLQVAKGLPHGAEDFSTFVTRSKPVVAINGAYASKTDLRPIGDMVVRGKLVYSGLMGTAFAITKDKQVTVKRVVFGHAEDWSRYETVIGCGPALVLNGKVDVLPLFEKFSDPHVMNPASRMGIGVTRENHLLIVNVRSAVSFHKFGEVMLALGCRDAMNLDAGASLGMYYRGTYHIVPSRQITNVVVVHIGNPPTNAMLNPNEVAEPVQPKDPGNFAGANSKVVELCADSMGIATPWCPQKVKRRLAKSRNLRPCPFHKTPPGER